MRASRTAPRSTPRSRKGREREGCEGREERSGFVRRTRVAFHRRDSGGGASSIAVRDRRRDVIAPLQILVADDVRLAADHELGAAIALREPAAEVVHGRFRIHADRRRVAAHVPAGVDAGRPPREVVALEPLPQGPADIRGLDDLIDGDAALNPDPAQVGTEGVALAAHGACAFARSLPASGRTPARTRRQPSRPRVTFFYRRLRFRLVELSLRRRLLVADAPGDDVGARVVLALHLRAAQPPEDRDLADVRERVGN